jgi:hypothetical protein
MEVALALAGASSVAIVCVKGPESMSAKTVPLSATTRNGSSGEIASDPKEPISKPIQE